MKPYKSEVLEMYKSKEYWAILVAVSIVMLSIFVVINDAVTYYDIKTSTYTTPWHSNNWLKEPYTEFKLLGMASNTHWPENASHSQRWLVKDTYVGDKVYWTILKRVEIK